MVYGERGRSNRSDIYVRELLMKVNAKCEALRSPLMERSGYWNTTATNTKDACRKKRDHTETTDETKERKGVCIS